MTLTRSTRVMINPEIIVGDVEGELVALHAVTDTYLHLNGSGSYIVERLRSEPMTFGALCDAVNQRYDVDSKISVLETTRFVTQCLELGLLQQENP